MSMDGRNPCDVCEQHAGCGFEVDCVFNCYPRMYICCNYDCFLNYDGDCLMAVFERCGAWKG